MTASFQIRECPSCGLRYPLSENHPFGERCPVCLGFTESKGTYSLSTERGIPFNEPLIRLEALLDNVRSAWNVGSIFRAADGFGLGRLHLCGITPTPDSDTVKKTSLGAERTVAWTYHRNALKATQALKAEGYKIFALEEDKRANEIQKFEFGKMKEKILLIAGSETTGVDPDLLNLCDEILYIPMRGGKKSFNVAMAFALAAYEMTRGSDQ